MKKEEENIVVFKPQGGEQKNLEENGEILNISKVLVLHNATLFSPRSMTFKRTDILIEDDKISKIEKSITDIPPRSEEIDLSGDYVLPFFINGYADVRKATEKGYGAVGVKEDDMRFLDFVKTGLHGVFPFFTLDGDDYYVLEYIAEKSEAELSEISNHVAETEQTLVLRVGRDLDELGAIDKHFHKPLSQVLEDFGFLDRNCLIVGGNCFDKDDWELFAQYGVSVVVCPMDDAQVGRRALNLKMLKNLGINVLLGSGDAAQFDYFEYMRQVIASQRTMFEEADALSEKEVLKMAFGGDFKEMKRLFHVNANMFSGLKKGSLANFLVVRNDINLHGDHIKNLVWEKNKNDVLITVFWGEIIQVCSLLRGFANMEDQIGLLGRLERVFARLRNKNKKTSEKLED